MWPFDDIGAALGDVIKDYVSSAFEAAMEAIWDAGLAVLREAFALADRFSVFSVDTGTGPVAVLWPMMLWISGVIALGLFFWQLAMTNLRGGRGFLRLVGGPVQYGIALAVTVGAVAVFLAAADGLTDGILRYGLQSANFSEAINHTSFGDAAVDGVKAVVLGVCAFIGVFPAAIGYVLEMLFREAAVYLLVATVPITAAGLLADITANWFWRTCRWLLAAISMKPVLALALVLGVAISGGSQGLSGLLVGVGVLVVSLLCPFVLFYLFAFVDPRSDAGAAFRGALAGIGVDSYGSGNPAVLAAGAVGGGGGGRALEDANTGRFDEAIADHVEGTMEDSGVGWSSSGEDDDCSTGGRPDSGGADSGGAGSDGGNGGSYPPPPANRGRVVSSDPGSGPTGDYGESADGTSGDGAPPSEPLDNTSPPGAHHGGSGAKPGSAAAGEAGEAAVIA